MTFKAMPCLTLVSETDVRLNWREAMIKRVLLGVSALLLGSGVAFAEEIEFGKQCDALGDAFVNYSAKKNDPDMEKATALWQEGTGDCKDQRYDEGINKINNAMGMMNDGMDSGRSGRR
jgi:hypothetical protein